MVDPYPHNYIHIGFGERARQIKSTSDDVGPIGIFVVILSDLIVFVF